MAKYRKMLDNKPCYMCGKVKTLLFSTGLEFQSRLDQEKLPKDLVGKFRKHRFELSNTSRVQVEKRGEQWKIIYKKRSCEIKKEDGNLNVYTKAKEEDHIPSKCLFSSTSGVDFIMLPICKKCHNSQLSEAEEYFRNIILAPALDQGNPMAESLMPRAERSMQRKEALKLHSTMIDSLVDNIDIYSEGGIYLGSSPGFKLNYEYTNLVIGKIVRGLYYHHQNSALIPNDAQIIVLAKPNRDFYEPILSMLSGEPVNEIGENIFSYKYAIASDHNYASMWLLLFYNAMMFLVFCKPANSA